MLGGVFRAPLAYANPPAKRPFQYPSNAPLGKLEETFQKLLSQIDIELSFLFLSSNLPFL